MKTKLLLCIIVFLYTAHCMGQDRNKEPVTGVATSHIYRPRKVDATADRISSLKLPPGFKISVFAQNVGYPRIMRVLPDGRVYVTDRDKGRLQLLKDTDGDGKADQVKTLLEMEHLHGIDFHDNKLYMVAVKEVYTADIKPDGTLGLIKVIISDLPDAGQHHNRTLKFGKDSLMYISIGSTCNSCVETTAEAAAMVVTKDDGKSRRVFAKGLRNTIGFDWHPVTGDLWAWDNGMDHLGDDEGKEEFNKLVDKGNYGWPYVYEKRRFDKHHDPKDLSHEQYADKCVDATLVYDAHAASMEFMFYTGSQFPAEYRNDGFVAMRGGWNRAQPRGYNVLRVKFDSAGKPIGTEEFLGGFLTDNNTSEFGRPVGLAQYIDGSLLVSDNVNGMIYLITYAPIK